MPNTKSAERRIRNSERKRVVNHAVKSRLRTLQSNFASLLAAGKRDEAAAALRLVSSAFDKAAKTGVVHASRASRKRSRLTLQFNKLAVK
jgi:small subunit ribosomal protein S20